MKTSNKVKYIKIKNRTYYFVNDIIGIESFDWDNIKIDEKSYRTILIYYIGYVTIKEYVKIYSLNPLYLNFRYANGCFEEINGNNYLALIPTNESQENIKKYEELWIKIKALIRSITKNSDDYDKKYIKIKFGLDDELPLNKTTEIPTKAIFVRAIFVENNKYYPQVFLDQCMYKI